MVLVIGTRLISLSALACRRAGLRMRIIQVDIHREELGRNRTIDVGIVGDARRVLEQLIAAARTAFPKPIDLPWIDVLRQSSRQNEKKKPRPCSMTDAIIIHPLRLCKEVRDFMDRDAILVVDGHEILNYASVDSYPHARLISSPAPMAAWAWRSPTAWGEDGQT